MVPLDETVRICAHTLYSGKFIPPDFPKAVFIELMQMATSGVEFSFNNTMYQQTDGIAIGSTLGSVLANIFLLAITRIKFLIFQLNHNFANDMWMAP